MSIDKIMTPAEAGGVRRLREWRLKEGAGKRSKNAMRMWNTAVSRRLEAESGSKYMQFRRNRLSSVVAHPMLRMRVLDNVPESTRTPDVCSLPLILFVSVFFSLVVLHPFSALQTPKWSIL